MTPAYLGFCAHTGWTVIVVIAPPVDAPLVVARDRLTLVNGGIAAAQAYHAAARLPPREGRSLVARIMREARARAYDAIVDLDIELQTAGYQAKAGGLPTSGGKLPRSLATILASHALIHTAEGVLFRRALIEALRAFDLPAVEIPARDLHARLAGELRMNPADLPRRLADAGRELGSPWGKHQKDCLAVAWLAMIAAERTPRLR